MLQIQDPCHESWDGMTASEKGKFCGACQKEVIDFTGMSDEALFRFFNKPSSGSVCGRFSRLQLNQPLIPAPGKRSPPWWRRAAALLFPALLLGCDAATQGKVLPATEQHPSPSQDSLPAVKGKVVHTPVYTISGRVMSKAGEPVPGAVIRIAGTSVATAANDEGFYSIDIRHAPGRVAITIEAIGYEKCSKKIKLGKRYHQSADIRLNMDMEAIALGEIIIKRD